MTSVTLLYLIFKSNLCEVLFLLIYVYEGMPAFLYVPCISSHAKIDWNKAMDVLETGIKDGLSCLMWVLGLGSGLLP